MTSSSSGVTIDEMAPTSRASFRLVAKAVGATNRESDKLRGTLLDHWGVTEGADELARRLRALEPSAEDGTHDVTALLGVWFSYTEPIDGKLVANDDPVLDGLPDELRTRLIDTAVESQDDRTGSLDA